MRAVCLVLVFAAACGGSGDGAVLSFTAPDGPIAASRIELVLASADSTAMATAKQRMRPGIPMEEAVVYYRQRSSVDAIEGETTLDGFEVRIQPDPSVVDDETFVPFALIYDAQDALIGVGTVNDENGLPVPVLVRPGTVASYDMAVVKLAPDTDDGGVAVGQGHAVLCDGEHGPWRSGAVWRTASGPQIRLLLPDVSADPAATDAMERATDLDCDDHAAVERDCDDLRAAYHPGQTETCDGLDTDCDGRPLELIEGCQDGNVATCGAPNVQLCADALSTTLPPVAGQCMASAACGCSASFGSVPPNCRSCSLDWTSAMTGASACAPAVGKLHIDQCASPGCSLEVVGADGPWSFKIGPSETGPFSSKLTGVTDGFYYLRAEYQGTAPFLVGAPTIGGAYVALTSGQAGSRPNLMPINLDLEDNEYAQCAASQTTGDNFMRCTP